MKVASWELFPDELRAALIQKYPAISWRVSLNRRTKVEGVNVGARRGGTEITIWLPAAAIEPMTLTELLEAIHVDAEQQLAVQRSP